MKQFHSNKGIVDNWIDSNKSLFMSYFNKAIELNLLTSDEIELLDKASLKFDELFNTDEYVLVHNDLHFDNVFYNDRSIKLIDFERSMYAPREYELGILHRMVRFPWKFASEENEKYTKYYVEFNIISCKISSLADIDFNYEFEKLRMIITNNILDFSVDNFNYVKDKSIDLLILFINLNKEYYIDNNGNFEIEDVSNELISNSELDEDIKSTLFASGKIKNTMLYIDLLYELVLNDKYDLRNGDSNNLIFSSNIKDNKKYYYLSKVERKEKYL